MTLVTYSKGVLILSIGTTKKLTLFITIDTEDGYFDVPRLITGEGLEGSPGISKVLDITEKYGFRSNIFLDVYGHGDFQPGVLQNIAVSIHHRGHAIELHTHPNNRLDFYKQNIYNYSLEQQIKILEYGKDLIFQWTGKYPVAHRGGSYAMNEDTLAALHQVGIPIDSTLFLNHKNNKIKDNFTVNKVNSFSSTLEVPITTVKAAKKNGDILDTKFDLDALSYQELVCVIQRAKEHNLRTLNLMLHSFSFINKKTKKAAEENDPRAIFRAPSRGGAVKCEIYGLDENDILKYEQLLKYIAEDSEIEVLTFSEWYKNRQAKDLGSDVIPVIDRSS